MFMIHTSGVDLFKEGIVFVVDFAGGLSLVVFQTDDRERSQGSGTNIGWIQIGVVGEDKIISSYRFAIGEFHSNAQAGSVLGGV